MEQKQRYKLGKHARLKSRKVIDQLFKSSRSFTVPPFRVIFQCTKIPYTPAAIHLQAGFSVSKRHFKKAVDRNRIKRLMREAYRLQKNELELIIKPHPVNLVFFIIYTGKDLPDYSLVFEKVKGILLKLQKISNETIDANT